MDSHVIAHRGASGYRPEHTRAAFELALDQGAEGVEVDVVMSRDGVPVVRHDRELSRTTDVASRPDLAERRRTRRVHGLPVTGWFAEDLDWAEIASLGAQERWPRRRPVSAACGGAPVLRLDDVLDLVARRRAAGRRARLLVELKDVEHLTGLDLPVDEAVADLLAARGWLHAESDVAVMSFQAPALRRLRRRADLDLVQLVDTRTRVRMREAVEYASGIGLGLDLLTPPRPPLLRRWPIDPRPLEKARRRGLRPYVWTLRAENRSLPVAFRSPGRPDAPGDLGRYARLLLGAGAHTLITDHPDVVVAARSGWRETRVA